MPFAECCKSIAAAATIPSTTGLPASPQRRSGNLPVLRVENVNVRFGGLLAVDNVELEAEAGRITGLIGPNGAGKTTLFNVITGLQTPTDGRVHIGDEDVTDRKPHKRARLRMARPFQRLEGSASPTARESI